MVYRFVYLFSKYFVSAYYMLKVRATKMTKTHSYFKRTSCVLWVTYIEETNNCYTMWYYNITIGVSIGYFENTLERFEFRVER